MVKRMVNVAEAKAHLSQLLEEARGGAEIVLAKNGKPCARLVALSPPARRPLGFLSMSVPESFFQPLPEEELAAFEAGRSPAADGRAPAAPASRRRRRRR